MGLSNREHAVAGEKRHLLDDGVFAGNKINGNLEKISNGYAHDLHSDSRILNCENSVDEDIQDSNDFVVEAPEERLTREEEEFSEIEMGKRDVEDIVVNDSETTLSQEIGNSAPDTRENHDITVGKEIRGHEGIEQPLAQLPKPEAPPGVSISTTPPPSGEDDSNELIRSQSLTENLNVDMPAIGKFIRERSNSISAAIAKRLSSLKDSGDFDDSKMNSVDSEVTEFNISGLKVIVKLKNEDEELKGLISFFSRSNCRDCTAVRTFFRERGLKFVEINIDVYPQREKELIERTGSSQVPQIFFNEKLFGGLVALNSLRNSGCFEHRLKEMLGKKCPDGSPAPPVYGFDDPEEESTDEMVTIVRVLHQRLPIQDRLMKMKIVKNCFAGAELVEVLIHHLDCGRRKAIDVGKQLARKHFIHHVFGQNDFEDGNHFYRFLEHEPFIPKCYNFRGFTNDCEPKPASMVCQRLTKIMSAILESYTSDNRCHVDYANISKSEEFRRYVNLTQDLQRLNLLELSPHEKLAFFLNLHNAMVIHAVIRLGHPEGMNDSRSISSDFQYIVGGYPYSLNTIKNGILRSNRRAPYSLVKPFGTGDGRLEIALPKVNPLIHFGLCNGTRSSPIVRFFTPQGIESELRYAARDFFQKSRMEVDLEKRTVHLTRIIKWFSADFGQEKEILKWIINYLDATKAGLLTHLLSDGGPINIVYQDYDWSANS
ncbi:hypothetical protein HS088_TW13G00689 [Tripterygium wilfordii]|uniref:DEP domain-containing protein n=1 Tax=Tripterygium wilfordii TaxID=458696 RepID=A0A7J7CV10_TRIWF|nr:uncharacterized protein LOC120013165 [Tripterygium wilfordii]KAF5737799.1 hypothetical protein HS088_TW13G00689 [Tripterygium wilfordii]